MRALKESIIALVLFIVAFTWSGCGQAAAKGVVTMNGGTFSADEVRNWWQNWVLSEHVREHQTAPTARPSRQIVIDTDEGSRRGTLGTVPVCRCNLALKTIDPNRVSGVRTELRWARLLQVSSCVGGQWDPV